MNIFDGAGRMLREIQGGARTLVAHDLYVIDSSHGCGWISWFPSLRGASRWKNSNREDSGRKRPGYM